MGIKNDHWIDHWFKEVHTLLDRNLVAVMRHGIKGFKDRRKALDEIFAEMKTRDVGYRRSADFIIKKDYKLKDLKVKIDDADTTAFWKRVADAIDAGLE
jgi:hypothetical protein